MSWCVYVSQGFCSSRVHHRESKSFLLSLYTWIQIVTQFLFGYNKEKSSEDYYKVVENQWKMKKKRSLKKNIQIQVSGRDDRLSSSYRHFRPDMEVLPQPTESTSSWSGSLSACMGRISSSDGEFRPDMETPLERRPNRLRTVTASSNSSRLPNMEAEPEPQGLSSNKRRSSVNSVRKIYPLSCI